MPQPPATHSPGTNITVPYVNSSTSGSHATLRHLPNAFPRSVENRPVIPSVSSAPTPTSTPYGSVRPFRQTRSDIPADVQSAVNENEDTITLLERCHTLVKLHSHDSTSPEVLDLIECLPLLVNGPGASGLRRLQAGAIERWSDHDLAALSQARLDDSIIHRLFGVTMCKPI